MPDIFSGLDLGLAISLVLALGFVLSYEFINGFHDTANAVATVIYTKAMPPHLAVIASGICNFFGVILGGLGVAYAIVHLLPVELLLNVGSGQGLVMVFSLLSAAIIWNLGTWYLGLPASSSHTLIGSILGVGLAHAWMSNIPLLEGINTQKAIDILLSLLISPTVGLLVAGSLLLLLKKFRADSRMHNTPDERKALDGKKHPPFWTRVALIVSSMGISFAHGSNDGQKGIGLLMLVLIGIVPGKFVVDMQSTTYQIERTHDAALHLQQFYSRNSHRLERYIDPNAQSPLPPQFKCDTKQTMPASTELVTKLAGVHNYQQLSEAERIRTRRLLLCLDDTAKKVSKLPDITAAEKADLDRLRKDLVATTEYAPSWVIVAIALALGLGTMIGWKRIVLTVGEKIGNKGMTYSQGVSAQITAAAAISVASITGMPVSTTHVLSSAVAGTMLANRSGLQSQTVRSILMAWVLTLPVSMGLAAGLFIAASQFIH